MPKYSDKIRLTASREDGTLIWQTYTPKQGWVTKGRISNAIFNRCKFAKHNPDKSPDLYCDTMYSVNIPMINTVGLFGTLINRTPSEFLCDDIPITKCDQVILMDGLLYKIA